MVMCSLVAYRMKDTQLSLKKVGFIYFALPSRVKASQFCFVFVFLLTQPCWCICGTKYLKFKMINTPSYWVRNNQSKPIKYLVKTIFTMVT